MAHKWQGRKSTFLILCQTFSRSVYKMSYQSELDKKSNGCPPKLQPASIVAQQGNTYHVYFTFLLLTSI